MREGGTWSALRAVLGPEPRWNPPRSALVHPATHTHPPRPAERVHSGLPGWPPCPQSSDSTQGGPHTRHGQPTSHVRPAHTGTAHLGRDAAAPHCPGTGGLCGFLSGGCRRRCFQLWPRAEWGPFLKSRRGCPARDPRGGCGSTPAPGRSSGDFLRVLSSVSHDVRNKPSRAGTRGVGGSFLSADRPGILVLQAEATTPTPQRRPVEGRGSWIGGELQPLASVHSSRQ